MYRETGRLELAGARLRTAIQLAAGAGALLNEAEAARDLAILCQSLDRNQEALRLLNVAYALFRRLDACADLIHVGGKVAELESVYLAVVRAWGRSLESRDGLTFGHCERVARQAVAVARRWGWTSRRKRPPSWAPTSTIWARCGSRRSCCTRPGP